MKQLEGENIGDAHNEQGHDKEAEKKFDRVLAIYVQSLGLEHVYVTFFRIR